MNKITVGGQLFFAGDKSLSHRAAIFGAMSKDPVKVTNFLPAADCENTLAAVQKLGANVDRVSSTEFHINGFGKEPVINKQHHIDVGNSGTGARLLMGLLSGYPGLSGTLDGDQSLRKRPMARVCDPLRNMGADLPAEDHLPIQVTGSQIESVNFTEVLGSAQVKSAVLLAGVASQAPIHMHEKILSRDHTEKMLQAAGVELKIEEAEYGRTIEMKPPYDIQLPDIQVWGDISSSAFFVVLALLASEGEILIRNVLFSEHRNRFIRVLQSMGANIEVLEQTERGFERGADLLIKPSRLRGVEISPSDVPALIDELPILIIAGAFADGTFSFRGAKELRVKESDRIHAMVQNLRACGVQVEEFDDGLKLSGQPNRLLTGNIESFHDHRIVMSFEIASLVSGQQLSIEGREWVNTSFPDFYNKLEYVTGFRSQSLVINQVLPRVITFDGHAGSGKSSLAQSVAEEIQFFQIDSGAIYRTVAYLLLQKPEFLTLPNDLLGAGSSFSSFVLNSKIRLEFAENKQVLYVGAEAMGGQIRTPEVTASVKKVAGLDWVRDLVSELVHDVSSRYPIIADGRDMGSEVFPQAQLKFFVTATIDERSRRRFAEFQAKNPNVSLEQVMADISKRDHEDENRVRGALKPASDAIFIDTTSRSIDKVKEIVRSYVLYSDLYTAV